MNDDRDIKRIKSALEQCLKLYCREIYFSFLDKNIKVFTDEEKNNILNNNNSVNRLSNQQTNYDLEPESDFIPYKSTLFPVLFIHSVTTFDYF